MSESKKLVSLIRELVKSEVKKELNQILINEGKKVVYQKIQSESFKNNHHSKNIPILTSILSEYLSKNISNIHNTWQSGSELNYCQSL